MSNKISSLLTLLTANVRSFELPDSSGVGGSGRLGAAADGASMPQQ